jgi:hypothetical protein
MTTQEDALKELIREANGVRKDLENERKAVARMIREAQEFVHRYAQTLRGDVEARVEEEIKKSLDESNKVIEQNAFKALSVIRKDFDRLRKTLLGRVPVEPDVRKVWREESGLADVSDEAKYYPDLEEIINAWPSLSQDQRELCRQIIEGGLNQKELAQVVVSGVVPDNVINAMDPTRQVVSKLQRIRQQHERDRQARHEGATK